MMENPPSIAALVVWDWTTPIAGQDLAASVAVSIVLALTSAYLGSRVALRKQRKLDAAAALTKQRDSALANLPSVLRSIDTASADYWWGYSDVDTPQLLAPEIQPGDKWNAVQASPRVSDVLDPLLAELPGLAPVVEDWLRDLVRPLDAIKDAPHPMTNRVIHQAGMRVTHTIVQVLQDSAARPLSTTYFTRHPVGSFELPQY